MENKSNTNYETMNYRKVVFIEKEMLKAWRKYFSLYGSRAEFERETGISNVSLTRILKNGEGEIRIIDLIKAFVESQNQTFQ